MEKDSKIFTRKAPKRRRSSSATDLYENKKSPSLIDKEVAVGRLINCRDQGAVPIRELSNESSSEVSKTSKTSSLDKSALPGSMRIHTSDKKIHKKRERPDSGRSRVKPTKAQDSSSSLGSGVTFKERIKRVMQRKKKFGKKTEDDQNSISSEDSKKIKNKKEIQKGKNPLQKRQSGSSFGFQSVMSSLSLSSESQDRENYIHIEEIDKFKEEVLQLQEDLKKDIDQIKKENKIFKEENEKMLQRCEKVDQNVKKTADAMILNSQCNFEKTLAKFEEQVGCEVKKWKRMNAHIEQKQDSTNHCMAIFSEITQCLSEELFKTQFENRENVENIAGYINLQISKDCADEKDREKMDQESEIDHYSPSLVKLPNGEKLTRNSVIIRQTQDLQTLWESLQLQSVNQLKVWKSINDKITNNQPHMKSRFLQPELPKNSNLIHKDHVDTDKKPIKMKFQSAHRMAVLQKAQKQLLTHSQEVSQPDNDDSPQQQQLVPKNMYSGIISLNSVVESLSGDTSVISRSPSVHSRVVSPSNFKGGNCKQISQNLKQLESQKPVKSRNRNQTQQNSQHHKTTGVGGVNQITSRLTNRSEQQNQLCQSMFIERKSMTAAKNSPERTTENVSPVLKKGSIPILNVNNLNLKTRLPSQRNVFTPPFSPDRTMSQKSLQINSRQVKITDSNLSKFLEEAEIPKISKNEIRVSQREYYRSPTHK